MPEVSVIMGICNGRRFLPATVASVLAQTFADWELIMVDNGSTDGGVDAVLAAHPDPRLRVFRYPEPLQPSGALIVACREARGRYLAVLDSDDLATPRRLEIQRAYLDLRPDVCLLAGDSELIDADDRPLGREPLVCAHEDIHALTAYGYVLRHSTVMFRRELLERVQYRRQLALGVDHDFFARAVEVGRVEALPALLGRYRLHPGSASHRRSDCGLSLGLVSLLTRRRRRGEPENLEFWVRRFAEEKERLRGDEGAGAHLFCARIFLAEGMPDLAAVHAWLAMRRGARWRGAWHYGRALLRGLRQVRGVPALTVKGWLKEPAHQLLRMAGGVPDRPQF